MSTYGAMIARIADEITLPELVPRIPKAIQSAIVFYESERFWFNESESTANTVIGDENIALPVDFLEPEVLTITETSENVRYTLTRRPFSWLRHHLLHPDSKARPSDWAYFADQIWLYPIPERVYILTMSMLKRLATLAALADTNDWMTHGEELIRSRAKLDLFGHSMLSALDPQKRAMIRDAVVVMRGATEDALFNLRGKSEQKIASTRLSYDQGLLTGRGNYNVNYQ